MLSCSRSHLADHVLLRTLAAIVTQDRVTTAEMLALIAEVDRRRAFRDEGYSSMYRYCVEKLRMSEDIAYKRILTARASRRFPLILRAIAEGSLTISTVTILRPYLKTVHAEALLEAAAAKTRREVELLIAERFPKADVPTTLLPLTVPEMSPVVPPAKSDVLVPTMAPAQAVANTEGLPAPGRVTAAPEMSNPASPAPPTLVVPVGPLAPQRRVAPLSPGRFELRLTISQQLHDKLMRAQELLGHAVPGGDIPQLLERALDELIARQEKLKFAGDRQAASGQKVIEEPASHPRRHETRGPQARRRPLHLRQRRRPSVR
jgi:hypothetical protein